MGYNSSWDRTHAAFDTLKTGGNISEFRGKRKLTREEKRERMMREYHSRAEYRRYGAGKVSYASVVFRNALFSAFGFFFFGIYLLAFVVAVLAIIIHGGYVASFFGIVAVGAVVFPMLIKHHSRRRKFVKKLKKLCGEKGIHLYTNGSLMKHTRRPSGVCDFSVETADTVYDVMFFPAPRRLSTIRFTQPDMAQVVTRILKNHFKMVLGLNNERVNFVCYSFEGSKITSKKNVKVLLMNPAPYSMQAYDKRENKVVETGSGAEFFGYTAYSGNGFLGVLERSLNE